MPYISEEKRKKYDNTVETLVKFLSEESENDVGGCLNYVVYKTIKKYLKK